MFTRPLSSYLKNSLKYKNDHHPLVRKSILSLGQLYHVFHIKIQRKVMNMSSSETYVKPLSDEKALEQGAEFFGEILAYGTLFVWGVYEVNKYANDAKAKDDKHAAILGKIDERLENLENGKTDLLAKIHLKVDGLDIEYNKIFKLAEKRNNKQYCDESTDTEEDML
ncbi:hypothetical protein SteCoe_5341 [Stentor coeruleus]|uniref:OPA3-like protein n=1 Tax=Stentor coeruleus TaxID=5963 RepID=A0A1R2CSN5_9CILI|nr:hypothetical protein SteCoe_5341 [Stentor coeruleus]